MASVRATHKQRLAAEKISDNIRNKRPQPIGAVLLEAGYSDSASKNPDQVTESRGFQELLNEYLPESRVTIRHGQLLDASHLEHYIFPLAEEDDIIKEIVESVPGCRLLRIRESEQMKRAYFWSPDNRSRKEAVDMAYKLRGNYKPMQIDVRSFTGWTPQELDDYASTGVIPERFIDAGEGESRA